MDYGSKNKHIQFYIYLTLNAFCTVCNKTLDATYSHIDTLLVNVFKSSYEPNEQSLCYKAYNVHLHHDYHCVTCHLLKMMEVYPVSKSAFAFNIHF